MKLTSDSNTLATNKVLILYILDKIAKPINNDGLYKLVLSIVDMNYFYFQQFLLDLLEDKYITTYTKEDIAIYEITTTGRETLKLTEDIVPGILKLKVDSSIKEELNIVEEGLSITADFTPHSEKEFTVTCKITENNITTFEIQTFVTSASLAKEIVDNWEKRAFKIYPKMIELLYEKDQEERPIDPED